MDKSKDITFGIQSQLSLAMVDGSIPKDLQKAQKGLNQLIVAENSNGSKAVLLNIQEQMTLRSYEMMEHINGDKEKRVAHERSILGDPPPDLRSKGVSHLAQSSNKGRPPSDLQPIQVYNPVQAHEFPKFDGTYPRAWMLRCNAYFRLVPSVLEEQKITYAVRHFEGRAAIWYDTFSSKNLDISWHQFVEIVAARFELLQEVQIVEDFHKLRMTGSYIDYVDQFEELKECMLVLNGNTQSEAYYIESFLSGLSDELKYAIKTFKPTTLQGAIRLGRDQSTAIDAIARRSNDDNRSFLPINTVASVRNVTQNSQNYLRAPPKTPTKWFTQAEFSARMDKRLCYNCDEKFTLGHRCVIRKNFMIMSEEEELEHLKIMAAMDEEDTRDTPMKEEQVSLNAINGDDGITTNSSTGICTGHTLQILLESGSTYSLTRESTTERLNSSTTNANPLLIKVTNGLRLISPKMVSDFTWEIQGHKLSHSLRVPQHEGSDITLGRDGLKARSPIKLDYCSMTVTGKLKVTLGWIQDVFYSYAGNELIAKLMFEEKTKADALPLYSDSGQFLRYKNNFLVRQQEGIINKFLQLVYNSFNGGHSGVHGLPKSSGKDVISFVIDRLTNSGHSIWLSDPSTSQIVAKLLMDNNNILHRPHVSLVADWDKVFTSHSRREQFKVLGVLEFNSNLSTTHHPQSAEQIQSLNHCMENYLKCMTSEASKQWFSWLSLAEHWHNTNSHTTLKSTLFQAVFDYVLPYLFLKPDDDSTTGVMRELILQKEILLQWLKENLGKARNYMKILADQSGIDTEFELGDQIYLKLQSYKQNYVLLRRHLKLSFRYHGPYTTIQKTFFHVTGWKKKLGSGVVYTSQLREQAPDGLTHIALTAVLDLQVFNHGNSIVVRLLIHRGSENSNLALGEDVMYILKKSLDFDPWGQGSLNGRGIVMRIGEENRRLEEASPELDGEVGGCAKIVFLEQEDESEIELNIKMIKIKSG